MNALAGTLPTEAVRLGHRCVGIVQTGSSARLHFAHGDSFEADMVIAADGIHSTLQKHVVDPTPPEYSGVRAYRGLISHEKLPGWPEAAHMVWMGDGKHFIVYPVRSGRLLNYVGFVPTKSETIESWSAAGDRDELAASFNGWDSPTVRLLETVEACFWWGLYDRRPLASWTSGRLVLLGDAAHERAAGRLLRLAGVWRLEPFWPLVSRLCGVWSRFPVGWSRRREVSIHARQRRRAWHYRCAPSKKP